MTNAQKAIAAREVAEAGSRTPSARWEAESAILQSLRDLPSIEARSCNIRPHNCGGLLIELQVDVEQSRRGMDHIVDEARSAIWEAMHEHRFAFTFRAIDVPSELLQLKTRRTAR